MLSHRGHRFGEPPIYQQPESIHSQSPPLQSRHPPKFIIVPPKVGHFESPSCRREQSCQSQPVAHCEPIEWRLICVIVLVNIPQNVLDWAQQSLNLAVILTSVVHHAVSLQQNSFLLIHHTWLSVKFSRPNPTKSKLKQAASLTGARPQARTLFCAISRFGVIGLFSYCLLYTSPSPRDRTRSRMPSSA